MNKNIAVISIMIILTFTFIPNINGSYLKDNKLSSIQSQIFSSRDFSFLVYKGIFSEIDGQIEGHISKGLVFGRLNAKFNFIFIEDESFIGYKEQFKFIIMTSEMIFGLFLPISQQINEYFHTNISAPYRFWRLELDKGMPIRVHGRLNEIYDGEYPRVDFIFFDGNTNDEFPELSEYNAISIDKVWNVPYDGIFFVGIECKYGFLETSGHMVIFF